MNHKELVILTALMFMVGLIAAESFVVPKKKRQTTVQVKQDNGQQLGAIIEECAYVIAAVNDLQQESIKQMHKLFEESNSYFVGADKAQLQAHGQLLTKITDDLRVTCKRMKNNFIDLKSAAN